MNYKKKLYVPSTIVQEKLLLQDFGGDNNWQDAVEIPKGTYDILSDDSSYGKKPSYARIQVAEQEVVIPFLHVFNNTLVRAFKKDFIVVFFCP